MIPKELSIHPILNLQSFNAIEMFEVIRDDNQVLIHSLSSYEHVKLINKNPVFTKFILYPCITVSIIRKGYNRKLFEQLVYHFYFFLEVCFFPCLCIISSIIEFMKRDNRQTTVFWANSQHMTYNRRMFRIKFNQCVCIKQIPFILCHSWDNLSCAIRKNGFHVTTVSSLLQTSLLHSGAYEVPAATPCRSYAAGLSLFLLVLPNVRLTTGDYSNSGHSACGEYFLMIV